MHARTEIIDDDKDDRPKNARNKTNQQEDVLTALGTVFLEALFLACGQQEKSRRRLASTFPWCDDDDNDKSISAVTMKQPPPPPPVNSPFHPCRIRTRAYSHFLSRFLFSSKRTTSIANETDEINKNNHDNTTIAFNHPHPPSSSVCDNAVDKKEEKEEAVDAEEEKKGEKNDTEQSFLGVFQDPEYCVDSTFTMMLPTTTTIPVTFLCFNDLTCHTSPPPRFGSLDDQSLEQDVHDEELKTDDVLLSEAWVKMFVSHQWGAPNDPNSGRDWIYLQEGIASLICRCICLFYILLLPDTAMAPNTPTATTDATAAATVTTATAAATTATDTANISTTSATTAPAPTTTTTTMPVFPIVKAWELLQQVGATKKDVTAASSSVEIWKQDGRVEPGLLKRSLVLPATAIADDCYFCQEWKERIPGSTETSHGSRR